MVATEEPKKAGRPPKPIDWTVFEQLCEIQCTAAEISSVLKVCEDTLYARVLDHYEEHYSVIYKRYAEVGKSSLRRAQFKLAMKNTSMAIWLGKQWLGQKDMSKEEMKDMAEDIKNAIRESETRPRVDEASRSSVENKQPVLDQRLPGKPYQVLNELGTTGAICLTA